MQPLSRLLGAEVVSNFGSMLSRLAIPWLATLTLNASPWQMGWLLAADVLAGAFGGAALGGLVDRHSPRAVMLWADALRAALLAALALGAAMQALSMPWLVLAAACAGLLTTLFEMARSAWMARQLPATGLVRANAHMAMGASLSETAAFALGGWLFQALGAALALVLDAISYLISALLVRGLPSAVPLPGAAPLPAQAPTPVDPAALAAGGGPVSIQAAAPAASANTWRGDLRQGLAAIAASPALRRMAGIEILLALAMSLTGTSYMVYVVRELGFSPAAMGMIAATGALGAWCGAVVAQRLGQSLGAWRAMAWGLAAASVGALCIPLAGAAPLLGAAGLGAACLVAHQVIGDGGQTLHQVHERTLRQTLVSEQLLARVDGALRSLGLSAQLFGALAGGALASAIGTGSALLLAAGLIAVAALMAARRIAPGRQDSAHG